MNSTRIHEVNTATFKTGLTEVTGNAKYCYYIFNLDLNLQNKSQ